MPLYHTMGVRSLLAMALVDGAFVCLPRFDAAAALRLIGRERVTNLYLVPTLYHDLVSHPGFAAADTGSVRKVGFAGAAMPDGLVKRVEAAFQLELFVNHYGSTEIYTFTIEPQAAAKPGSAGKAGFNQRIRVVRHGAGAPHETVAVGEEGEIIADMEGDEAFEGYWRRPDADVKAVRQGWYFTGDTGYVDAAGDLFVTGRVDDMIISGGENISPSEIESVLSLHPAVAEVAVAGLPDERWGSALLPSSDAAARSIGRHSMPGAASPAWPITSGRATMSSSSRSRNRRSASSCAACWWPGSIARSDDYDRCGNNWPARRFPRRDRYRARACRCDPRSAAARRPSL